MFINSSAVIGASGKMGRGIAACLVWKMIVDSWQSGKNPGCLYLHDIDSQKLIETRRFLKAILKQKAEKNIVFLRSLTRDNKELIDNSQIIDYFESCLMDILCLTQSLSDLHKTEWVFEAISEDLDLKRKIFVELDELCDESTRFLTNTSSFPIHLLKESLSANRFLASFHFYNPPEKQLLLECVVDQSDDLAILKELANSLNKKIVLSGDVPGFIGNGFFVRESLQLMNQCDGSADTLYRWDQIYSRGCLRPMACFELIDYVGVDVFYKIATFMDEHIEGFYPIPDFLKILLDQNLCGGYTNDFCRLDGFYQYQDNQKVAMYDFLKRCYVPLNQLGNSDFDLEINWRSAKKDSAQLKLHFERLAGSRLQGEVAAVLQNEINLADELIRTEVCKSKIDLDRVLMWGFGHLYGVDECRQILSSWEATK